jgi:uncharacterized alpha-E superfamily protein
VRGSITSEMWDVLNSTWLELQRMQESVLDSDGVSEFFYWVKDRSHLFRGVTVGTALHDQAFQFNRLGTFLERADNTARILDVKYHTLLPSAQDIGGAVDYYQWSALLRSVSAFSIYRKIYRDLITPFRVAEVLILREDVPRSLHACMNEIYDPAGGVRRGPARARAPAGEIHAQLHYGKTERIFKVGSTSTCSLPGGDRRLNGELNKHFLMPTYA